MLEPTRYFRPRSSIRDTVPKRQLSAAPWVDALDLDQHEWHRCLTRTRGRARRILALALYLLAWLAVMSQFAHADYTTAYAHHARGPIETRVRSELQAWQVGNLSIYRYQLASGGINRWRENQWEYFAQYWSWSAVPFPLLEPEIRDMAWDGDLLQVMLWLHGEDPAALFQELRFYRRVNNEWQRVAPYAALESSAVRLRTSKYSITAYAIDAATASRAVEGLDAFSERVHRDFGVVWNPGPRLELELHPPPYAPLFGYAFEGRRASDDAIAILRVPLAFGIARAAMNGDDQRLERLRGKNLYIVAEGLIAWEAHQFAPPPRAWQVAERRLMRDALARGYAVVPHEMTRRVMPLGGLAEGGPLLNLTAWTIADYIAARFGPQRFVDLIDGIMEYGQWSTLTREVFGVSLEEFEKGWRAHVEQLFAE